MAWGQEGLVTEGTTNSLKSTISSFVFFYFLSVFLGTPCFSWSSLGSLVAPSSLQLQDFQPFYALSLDSSSPSLSWKGHSLFLLRHLSALPPPSLIAEPTLHLENRSITTLSPSIRLDGTQFWLIYLFSLKLHPYPHHCPVLGLNLQLKDAPMTQTCNWHGTSTGFTGGKMFF